MATTPTKTHNRERDYKTPKKCEPPGRTQITEKKGSKAVINFDTGSSSEANESVVEVLVEDSDDENKTMDAAAKGRRRSARVPSPNKRYAGDFVIDVPVVRKRNSPRNEKSDEETEDETDTDYGVEGDIAKPKTGDLQLLQDEVGLAGKVMFGFHTPKKKGGMALAALNTPKAPSTPKTPKIAGRLGKTPDTKRSKPSLEPKTPSHVRHKVKNRKFFSESFTFY